jgi:indolepyruvate ferredoxin oxidoreductase
VTIAQTLATAAMLDGRYVAGLDQTGLAQKGGAVVSDLRLGIAPSEQANKLDAGDCDLYLVADLLVGASAKHLVAADPGRTVAVVSTARVPTGLMVVDTAAAYPDPDELMERILRRSRSERHIELDAPELARRLVGTELVANMLLVGAAYQAGRLPISAASIERAIQRNGAAVAANLQAFRRGRQAISDPPGLSHALGGSATARSEPPVPSTRELRLAAGVAAPPGSELHKLVVTRVAELVAYQDERYAARYVTDVERARAAEAERAPGSTAFAEAVAVSLHKLMAYKDEYEVARLHLDPAVRRDLEARFGADAKVEWKLHPPMLRALGLDRKVTLGAWFAPAFRALVAMRRVRGTRFDPFGATHIRRTERLLIANYRALIGDLVAKLSAANYPTAVEIASLPDLIRGYETIKLASLERYYAELTVLLAKFDSQR